MNGLPIQDTRTKSNPPLCGSSRRWSTTLLREERPEKTDYRHGRRRSETAGDRPRTNGARNNPPEGQSSEDVGGGSWGELENSVVC